MEIDYDVRNPPISSVIATYTYTGPPIAACGNPEITLEDDIGSNLSFLTASFDSVTGFITISLPDVNAAVKGDYTLNAVFTLPGSFDFPLGLTLQIYDICDDSYFSNAPVLSPDN